jgi:hypothetical protein
LWQKHFKDREGPVKSIRVAVVLAVAAIALLAGVSSAAAAPSADRLRPVTAEQARLLSTSTIRPFSNGGTCLDVYAGGKGPWVQAWTCNGQGNQQFYLVGYADAGNWEVRSADTWCVDSRYGRGASLQHSPCTGIAGERFKLLYDTWTGGYLFESAQYPGQVWDVYDSGRGTEVQLWDKNLTPNQEWYFA